jgi:hypothetical protein
MWNAQSLLHTLFIWIHPFHSLLAHLLEAFHLFRKDQLIYQNVQALVRTVVSAIITHPADPFLPDQIHIDADSAKRQEFRYQSFTLRYGR